MNEVNLDVYLFFKGECREAMEFYRKIFGGELNIQSYSEVPGVTSDHPDWVMHANLSGGDIKLMASDTEQASPKAAKISLSLGGRDEMKLRQIFGELSAGGEVNSPLKKEFWGDIFGSLTDKYGVEWMVNVEVPKTAG